LDRRRKRFHERWLADPVAQAEYKYLMNQQNDVVRMKTIHEQCQVVWNLYRSGHQIIDHIRTMRVRGRSERIGESPYLRLRDVRRSLPVERARLRRLIDEREAALDA
jgi:hypothetical protein